MTYYALPNEETGYQLDNGYSFWSIVVPEATENLITNPSLEFLGATGFNVSHVSASGSSSVRATGGVFSMMMTPNGGGNAVVDYNYRETGQGAYTFSADIYHTVGETYTMRLTDGSRVVLGQYTFVATYTGWGRYEVTYLDQEADGSGLSRYAAVVSAQANPSTWWTDRWQVERKPYATTYCDGDLRDTGFLADPYAYGWMGEAHQSRSYRSAGTFSGGRPVSLWDFIKFRTTGVVGLGLTAPDPLSTVLADGRELLTGFNDVARTFSVVGKIYAADVLNLDARVQALVDLCNTATRRGGELILRYQPVNGRGRLVGMPLDITCLYQGGLEGNFTNFHQVTVEMKFKATKTALVETIGTTAALSIDGSLEDDLQDFRDSTGVIVRDPNTGEWDDLAESGATNGEVVCAVFLPDGSIVVGGAFTEIAGVVARRCAKWDVRTRTWSEVAGGFNGIVYSMAVGKGAAAGNLFLAGAFTANGSGAGTRRRAGYLDIATLATFTELDGGLDANAYAIMSYHDGTIYVGGVFTEDSAANPMRGAAKYNVLTDSLTDLGLCATGQVNALAEGPDGLVYAGGQYTYVGGGGAINMMAYNPVSGWDTTNFPVGEFCLDNPVNVIAFDPAGALYAGGSFGATVSLRVVQAFARWNGNFWEKQGGTHITNVTGLAFDKRGIAYLNTDTATATAYASTQTTITQAFDGYNWFPFGVIGSTQFGGQIVVSPGGHLLICYNQMTDVHYAGHTEVNYRGTAPVQPSLRIVTNVTQGVLFCLSNWTTGSHIYFKSLILPSGDHLYMDFTGDTPRIYTLYQGDITNQILLGMSDLATFRLVPGINHISLLIKGSNPSTLRAFLHYHNQHQSITVASR